VHFKPYTRTVIELYGTVAVSGMALSYSLEERGSAYRWLFAASCLAAASYAALIGPWPFAVIETLWAGVAARRAMRRENDDA